jgi:hypothetical protein
LDFKKIPKKEKKLTAVQLAPALLELPKLADLKTAEIEKTDYSQLPRKPFLQRLLDLF